MVTAIAVGGCIVAMIAMLWFAVAASARYANGVAVLVEGENELAVVPVDRVTQILRASYGSITPALAGVVEIRVTNRRLHLCTASGPRWFVNLEPDPGNPTLPPIDAVGTVFAASREPANVDFDRVELVTRGKVGQRELVRLLIQLPDGHRLATLIKSG